MNTQRLLAATINAQSWNAALYLTHKLTTTALTFIFYYKLTPNDFVLWATINSTIFLALLWLDCGLRKSIPRYIPTFAQVPPTDELFIRTIICFQSILLISVLPFFLIGLYYITLPLNSAYILYVCAGGLFITEGIVAIIRLVYHAYFANKQFNLLVAVIDICATLISILLVLVVPTHHSILIGIITTKIISSSCIVLISTAKMKRICYNVYLPTNTYPIIDTRKTMHEFVKHSAIMWINNAIKSISERNFLMVIITYTSGPYLASLFKVANDGALLFYRLVLKTIGTTDTSLFSYIELSTSTQKSMAFAFTKLTMKIASLCIPLIGIVFIICIHGQYMVHNQYVFHLFIIMVVGYLIETVILPYERILEIKRNYWYLCISYMPYVGILALLLPRISSIGLITSIIIIQSVRLVSLFMIIICTRMLYPFIQFPLRFLVILSLISFVGFSIVHGVLMYFSIPVHYFLHFLRCFIG